jgi:hypothetical protein
VQGKHVLPGRRGQPRACVDCVRIIERHQRPARPMRDRQGSKRLSRRFGKPCQGCTTAIRGFAERGREKGALEAGRSGHVTLWPRDSLGERGSRKSLLGNGLERFEGEEEHAVRGRASPSGNVAK